MFPCPDVGMVFRFSGSKAVLRLLLFFGNAKQVHGQRDVFGQPVPGVEGSVQK